MVILHKGNSRWRPARYLSAFDQRRSVGSVARTTRGLAGTACSKASRPHPLGDATMGRRVPFMTVNNRRGPMGIALFMRHVSGGTDLWNSSISRVWGGPAKWLAANGRCGARVFVSCTRRACVSMAILDLRSGLSASPINRVSSMVARTMQSLLACVRSTIIGRAPASRRSGSGVSAGRAASTRRATSIWCGGRGGGASLSTGLFGKQPMGRFQMGTSSIISMGTSWTIAWRTCNS